VYSAECLLGLGLEDFEFPRAWPPAFRFVGPVLYTPPGHAGAAPRLEPERRHVLVTLGTQIPWAKEPAVAALREQAARERGWVVHFSDGVAAAAGGDAVGEDGEFFRRYRYVRYDDWLGRFDVVVHHGGAGVLYACLAEARPALVWPVDYDQFDHAVRLERIGLGERLRSWSNLPAALERITHDEGRQKRAAEWQARLRASDAPGAVVELVRRMPWAK
jgi:UDP:flavonoid glycosyltransferase YjiC (YdhE family)